MCKPRITAVLLGLLFSMSLSSGWGQSGLPCTLCPANANATGLSPGISVQRLSDGSFVNPGESVLPCETLLVNSDVGFKTAVGAQVFSAFVGVTAEMFVNGVSAGSVAPATLTTTRVGPAGCADTLDESMDQFTYVIQPADAGTTILFRMDFAGKASLGGTCNLNVTGSPEIQVDVISCDDGDPCTDDSCDVVIGCINTPKDCDDSNPCTDDSCDPITGACVNTPKNCDDGDPCTDDSCDPVTGDCVNTDNGTCGGNAGCTPGFFKNCTSQWPCGVSTSTPLCDVFDVAAATCLDTCNLCSKSLLDALKFQGNNTLCGGAQILLRAAAAAYLNSLRVAYPLSTADVISQVNQALLDSCTQGRTALINLATILDANNNLGCVDSNNVSLPCKGTPNCD